MNLTLYHIPPYQLLCLGTLFTSLALAMLLWFAKKKEQAANRLLILAIGVTALEVAGLPFAIWLTLGPLLYGYVRRLTSPERRLKWRDALHLCPLLAGYWLPQPLVLLSLITYLFLSHRLIQRFYNRLRPVLMDRPRFAFRRLDWTLLLLGVFGLLTMLNTGFRLAVALTLIAMAAKVLLKTDVDAKLATDNFDERERARRLKEAVAVGRLYQDTELTLASLAVKLGIHPHDLSRIINIGLKKNFNDFINEFRVREVTRKMKDPACERFTLIGIAYESGFNSERTFHRVFKKMTGKTPLEYKSSLRKELPIDKLAAMSSTRPVILRHETHPTWAPSKINPNAMFKNHLKSAWRHIMRHKTYSAINVMGLALGICGCIVVYLVVSYEFSFDSFHPDKDRIYCIDINMTGASNGFFNHWNSVPAPMPDAMRREMSGLGKVAAFQHFKPKAKIKEGEKIIKTFDETNGIIAEADYFDILPYTWLSGSKKTALNKPLSVVLTLSRAKTYFGDLQPDEMIGKTITYNDSITMAVTGIIQDWNKNSNFNFSDFISYSSIQSRFLKQQFQLDNWENLDSRSQELVKLPPGVNPEQINEQFPSFVKRHFDPQSHLQVQLQPFTGIHFHREYGGPGTKADLSVLYILSAVAIFILLIAAINFINLSTAQSVQRTAEIGIRKVLGSGRSAILFQFLTETFILALLAVVISVAAIRPLLNLFAAYIPQDVKFDYQDYVNWAFLAGIAIFTTLLAGFYPARLLSVFRPVSSLKGEINEKTANKGYLRKSLIVFQFSISLIFIIATIMIGKQVNYMQTSDLGFKPSKIITLKSPRNDTTGKIKVFAERVRQLPGVGAVIAEAFPPMGSAHSVNQMQLQGGKQPIQVSEHSGNESYVPFYDMRIIAGRNLLPSDTVREYLINQTAAKALGFNSPQQAIGKLLTFGGGKNAYPIAGVIADFYENSFHEQIMPVIIENDPKFQMDIALKLTPAEYQKGDMELLVNRLAKEWKAIYPEEPFNYTFLGDSIARLYDSDRQTQWLMRTATLVTIFISCMGLFGLAMFTTERRTKEISIRKVLGASVPKILVMLNKEVFVLITISLLISSPVAWLFIHKWLQSFAYHANLNLWVFIMAGVGAMLIALATISFRTVRSAMANPVKGLRNE
ncbi:MAG: ABC transporter permease [Bacteroidetes bacterium]|nr:ABC transporter permease [Bacteroidota bacterium]